MVRLYIQETYVEYCPMTYLTICITVTLHESVIAVVLLCGRIYSPAGFEIYGTKIL